MRLASAIDLAGLFCTGPEALAKVVGSTAFAMHLYPGRIRTPNDVDIVWLTESHDPDGRIRSVLSKAPGWKLVGDAHKTKLRSGEDAAVEYRIERWTHELEDRLSLQHCVRWPDRSAVERIHFVDSRAVGSTEFFVEPLAWCVVHKLDGIFKPRSPGWVSSRCRDLFDLALIDEGQLDLLAFEIESHVATLGRIWTIEPAPPPEWSVVWARLAEGAGYNDLRITEAWASARSLAARMRPRLSL